MTVSPSVGQILKAIMSADPDGGEVEPTQEAYAAHRRWAVTSYGQAMWTLYRTGGWSDHLGDEPRHVEY